MRQVLAITRKELRGYFGSPMALIFLGAFLAATLFAFFWVDTFFARGIADVRPLFRWMPVLMIFLVSALTMRQWSEEERSGTLELLLTLPASPVHLVIGKFLAVVALVVIALALTISLPLTVSLLGNLDWGPVFGGYLAAVLLAAAYAGIGLFVSSRTDNQIVALIVSVLVCGVLYIVGTNGVAGFFGDSVAEGLRAIGSGSRFESIERGVIDLRDLIYYLALIVVFLTLNVSSLKSKGWSHGQRTLPQRQDVVITTLLVVLNLVVFNVWVYPLRGLRVDLTAHRQYTLSSTTRDLLQGVTEPLLIRGYFSERTHPLLAPLVPRVRDMLREYDVMGGGNVQVEIIDPADNPEMEAEANQVYGIRPTPFQVAGRYEASIINSYFDIFIRYGDQTQTLSFSDLVEVEQRRDGTVDVRLRNLEYDLTSAIKKAVYGFQSLSAVLASLDQPARVTLYVTPDTLPDALVNVLDIIDRVVGEMIDDAAGKLEYVKVDPDVSGSDVSRDDLYERYGLQPIPVSLFSNESYYFYLVVEAGDEVQVVYPESDMAEAEVRTAVESALKRASSGFLPVVGLWLPEEVPTQDAFGNTQPSLASFEQLQQALRQEYELRQLDLTTGEVSSDVDVLLLVAPQGMTDVERYAIDQYLMRGGAIIAAAGNYKLTIDQMTGGPALESIEGGLRDLLTGYGVFVEESVVMDQQNEPFPMTVNRQVGDYAVQEIQALDYPYFVDIRQDGMADSPIVSNLSAVTMQWASPVIADEAENADRDVTILLQSSPSSWVSSDTTIQPDFEISETGFVVGSEQRSYPLAVSVQGVFGSAFKEQGIPQATEGEAAPSQAILIESSSPAARLVVFGSAEFLNDTVFQLSSTLSGDRYLNNLQLVHNAVAWATEDLDLLEIRSRETSARVLAPMSERVQSFWEAVNYVVVLLALLGVGFVASMARRNEQPMELMPPEGWQTKGEVTS